MVRLTPFPLVFGSCLVVFAWGFVYRRKLFPEVEEIKRQRAVEKQRQAVEFRQKFAEGIKRERDKKAAEQKTQ